MMSNEAKSNHEADIQRIIEDMRVAGEAGKTGFCNIEPEIATIYHFCVMHMPHSEDNAFALAEALDRADQFDQHRLMSEYAAAYLTANGIQWGVIEIIEKPIKYKHGSDENSYHFCFRALVKQRSENN